LFSRPLFPHPRFEPLIRGFLASELTKPSGSLSFLIKGMFAVLHIADFPLHAVLRTEPGIGGRPAALFATTTKKSAVLAANPPARACGVELGMSAPQAVARCPALLIRTPSPAAENEARAALLAVGFTLSPAIEDTAPGICTADLKGSSTRPEPIATAAIAELAQLGLPTTSGIARTPLLALYAARAGRSLRLEPPDSPDFTLSEAPASLPFSTPEQIEDLTNVNAFDDVVVVTDETTCLSPLPLSTADPSPELAAILANWGLSTLGDLTALPRDEIVRRFGSEGLALWKRATGGDSRPLHLVTPPQSFRAEMEFEQEIETLEPLLFILRRFLDRLTLELRVSQHVAAAMELTLRLEDDTRHARGFRLPEPTADPEILFRTLHTHLESLHTTSSITALELRLVPTRPLVRQHGLFETGLRDPHGFAETLARVAALVNSDRVGTPHLDDTHRPDAVKLVPPPAVVPSPAEPPVHPPLGLPLRRFRPPLPATLEFTPSERKPTYLFTDQFRGEISDIRGPWRSSGDWWQKDQAWQRTEYDVALADGGLYRLLQIGEAWFVEGEYD
jgi:protein ImuB